MYKYKKQDKQNINIKIIYNHMNNYNYILLNFESRKQE